MARDYRTLKLEILAETKQFTDDMKKSETQVEGFGGKLEKFGKVAAAAFAAAAAAAAAYAAKLAVDGVKAALDDEKAQRILALTLQNVTKATNGQIAAVEEFISKTALATGVTDDQLRPAFSRLIRSTKDVEEAQKLLNLALDVSSATQKPLEAITAALGKAYDGNTNALGRLGLGIDQNIIKSKDFDRVANELRRTFGGFAAQEAETLQGQIQRLNVAFDEAKEAVGFALLPAIKAFIDYVTNRLIPMLIEAKDRALAPIKKAFEDNEDAIKSLWQFTKDYLVPLFEFTLIRAIEGVGKAVSLIVDIIGGVVNGIKSLINEAVSAINNLISFYNQVAARVPFLSPIGFIGGIGGSATNAGGGERAGGFLGGGGGAGAGIGFGGNGGGAGGGGAGGGGVSLSDISKGLVKSPEDLLSQIAAGAERLDQILFAYETGQINKTQAKKLVAQTEKDLAKLERIATAYTEANIPMGSSLSAEDIRFKNAAAGGSVLNITINGAIDPVSTARQVQQLLNNEASLAGNFSDGVGVSRFSGGL